MESTRNVLTLNVEFQCRKVNFYLNLFVTDQRIDKITDRTLSDWTGVKFCLLMSWFIHFKTHYYHLVTDVV